MHAFYPPFFFLSLYRPNYLADVNFVVLLSLSLVRSGSFFSFSSRVCLPSSARKVLFFTLALRLIRANKSERKKTHRTNERAREKERERTHRGGKKTAENRERKRNPYDSSGNQERESEREREK